MEVLLIIDWSILEKERHFFEKNFLQIKSEKMLIIFWKSTLKLSSGYYSYPPIYWKIADVKEKKIKKIR